VSGTSGLVLKVRNLGFSTLRDMGYSAVFETIAPYLTKLSGERFTLFNVVLVVA
jgi:hypothetical protein